MHDFASYLATILTANLDQCFRDAAFHTCRTNLRITIHVAYPNEDNSDIEIIALET